jgi:superfamily II DNA/RNA helicase
MEITEPTEIQSRAIRVVVGGGRGGGGGPEEEVSTGSSSAATAAATNVFIASHTGSGKTLAYLLPVIQSLKLAEERAGERLAKPRRPKVVVACPTRELAEQVEEVTKSLSHSAKFSSYLVVGGRSYGTQRQRLDAPIDVVIGTPGRLVKHVEQGNLYLGNVDAMILDEADTLFEAGFGDEVKRLLRPLKARPEGKTCVLVSATMPDRLRKLVDDELPGLEYVRTETLHRSAPGLKHRFVDCPGDVDKMSVLEQIVAPEHKSGKKIMIFCNTLPSCVAVERTMAEADIATTQYHGDMTSDARAESMRDFISATSRDNLTMVCTDLAARGLDFGRIKVDHVINFDFPMNALDYIHRSGRTARAGAGGKVTNLVAKKDRILAGEIDSAVKLGLPIDNATSSRAVSEARKKKALADARDRRSGGASRVKRASVRDAPRGSNRGRRGAARFETNDGSAKKQGARPRRPGGRR